jgi:hypothetical protein
LYLIVAGLIIGEDHADVVHMPEDLVDVPRFLPLYYQGRADDLGGCGYVEEDGLVSSGEVRTGGLVMSTLSSSSAFCVSSIQQKELDFFSSLYRGGPCFPSQDLNWLRSTRHPMSH